MNVITGCCNQGLGALLCSLPPWGPLIYSYLLITGGWFARSESPCKGRHLLLSEVLGSLFKPREEEKVTKHCASVHQVFLSKKFLLGHSMVCLPSHEHTCTHVRTHAHTRTHFLYVFLFLQNSSGWLAEVQAAAGQAVKAEQMNLKRTLRCTELWQKHIPGREQLFPAWHCSALCLHPSNLPALSFEELGRVILILSWDKRKGNLGTASSSLFLWVMHTFFFLSLWSCRCSNGQHQH